MSIEGIKVGFKYHESYFIPNTFVKIPATINQNAVKLSILDMNNSSLRSSTQEHFVEYWNDESKRMCFRGIKLVVEAIALAQKTNYFKALNPTSQNQLMELVRSWSETFGMPLNGLTAFQKIKDMILNDILKDININSRGLSLSVYDIERGTTCSKVREFKVRY